MGVIYLITNPNGRKYVGRTKHIGRRINTYKYRAADKKETKSIVVNSIRKYGWGNHKFEILEECPNDLLNEREKYWIIELKTYFFEYPDNMNMSLGGEEGGRKWMFDVERRKKQSERFTGSGNTFYGKTHTKEWREKKSKEVSEYNKKVGWKVPEWGAEKGWAKVMKEVVAYNSDGTFIGEYKSLVEAANAIGVSQQSVKDSVSRDQWTCGKYLFKYKTENYPLSIEPGIVNIKTVKRPVLTLTPDYEVVCEHESAKEASDFWGVPKTTINRAAMYNWLVPIRSGHVFIYKDLYAEILKATA